MTQFFNGSSHLAANDPGQKLRHRRFRVSRHASARLAQDQIDQIAPDLVEAIVLSCRHLLLH